MEPCTKKNDKKTDTWFENVKPSTGSTCFSIDHFTIVCSISWPMNASELEVTLL